MPPSSAHNIASLLARTAHAWPRLPAVALGARTVSDYASLAARVSRQAGAFAAAGLNPGDRVALIARNDPAYVETLFGCWWAGLAAVPVNAKLHPKELAHVLENSGARWAFVDPAWHAAIGGLAGGRALERVVVFGGREHAALAAAHPSAVPFACSPEDPAWLFYTSGTTGRPKGVVISHGNLAAMTRCFLTDVETVAPGDAILHPAPLSHGSGLYVLPHVHSGAVNVIPESGALSSRTRSSRCCSRGSAPACSRHRPCCNALSQRRRWRPRDSTALSASSAAALRSTSPMPRRHSPHWARAWRKIYGQGESPMTITAMNRALVADAILRGDGARLAR